MHEQHDDDAAVPVVQATLIALDLPTIAGRQIATEGLRFLASLLSDQNGEASNLLFTAAAVVGRTFGRSLGAEADAHLDGLSEETQHQLLSQATAMLRSIRQTSDLDASAATES